ncbi:MAG: PTS sugar transporter subunit IIA [Kiritimatiellae bacterium]|nr:PTS sugar transporter subunit IIA [Kiritimatiellia bacterium]MBQ3340425.1 PTS sugar transporter subunit IIA [Kiritimatiellia bacterium]MBQ6330043.1 PTS sugar transporter subunit IIA [Kiritimatiellia bacterium]
MSREILTLRQAAEHIHMSESELRHCAQRGEVEAFRRGDDWCFEHRTLDEWAQRALLAAGERDLRAQHRVMVDERRRSAGEGLSAAPLFDSSTIDLALGAKAKAGILRDMTDLAVRGGKVYDAEALFRELVAREEAASTAVGEGVALLHPRFHDPYLFEESFVAYGRSVRPIFFGASNGEGTRHFFLICSTDHAQHLHILARLAVLAHGTELIPMLDAAETAADVVAAIASCEEEFAS